VVIVAVFFLCAAAAAGLMVHQARADASVGGPTAAVMGNTWSVIAGPITKGGDVVGYNVHICQEKTGMLWTWEHGADKQLIRVPTREQYERDGIFDRSGSSKPRGEKQ